jgi:hypothetical protein
MKKDIGSGKRDKRYLADLKEKQKEEWRVKSFSVEITETEAGKMNLF